MSEFEEWNKYNLGYTGQQAFEAGQQSQQAKIDELIKQRDSFIKAHHIAIDDVCVHAAKNKELQGRIDEALNTLCKLQYSSGERIYNDVGNILKGNGSEIESQKDNSVIS